MTTVFPENNPQQHKHSHKNNKQHHHGHIHSEESQRKIINRLSRIEGHVRGIKTMINEGRDCPEVLIQIAAIRGALDRVARLILDEHLSECITRAAEEGGIEEEIAALKSALDRFLPS
ncbi:metal-sensing transcriptional repressor [Cyanobacterium aponinum]|uniref:Metal-sensing transcriptional repressor n=1 Tax=Cyanobacterium aponinum 0216 TaxID=2676140 RepID=A0A844GZJ2_9CHRO|nr:metal-sensitive transcriptional regulator [Cyanobacterium aponinum]MTF39386.1 metal-sensing transcriptional repressor [Cyanobacterium aponinum 0216]